MTETNKMKVTLMLADSAQAVGGKLYILGGGWSYIGPQPVPTAIAVKVEVPWSETNKQHHLKIELFDSDFKAIKATTPTGEAPVMIGGDFEVGRPPGAIPGIPIDMPLAFNIGPIPLEPGKRFIWKLSINDTSYDDWQLGFTTRTSDQVKTGWKK